MTKLSPSLIHLYPCSWHLNLALLHRVMTEFKLGNDSMYMETDTRPAGARQAVSQGWDMLIHGNS
jgi:hypothetical protein